MLKIMLMLALLLTGCRASGSDLVGGSIGFMPYFSQEIGIRGVTPIACPQGDLGNFECEGLDTAQGAVIIQQPFRGTRFELLAVLLPQLSIDILPTSTGRFKGEALTWELYAFEAQIQDVGGETFRFDLALAEGDATSYIVALVTQPADYAAHTRLFETVFEHVVYGLVPLE